MYRSNTRLLIDSGLYTFGRTVTYEMLNVYTLKMAGVFMISTCTLSLRTGIIARWMAYLGLVLALFLLLSLGRFSWAPLVFPLWVFLISVHILRTNLGRSGQSISGRRLTVTLSPDSRSGPREISAPFYASAASAHTWRPGVGLLCLLLLAAPLSAQDLDPRAYANVPVNGTFLIWGFAVSHGGVVSDPTLPVTDINATVETPSVGVARSFSLFGKTAQAFGVLPYSWAQVSGKVLEESRSITPPASPTCGSGSQSS